jgi:hypothetical protein
METNLLETYYSDKDLYQRLERKLEKCRKLMKTVEKKCQERAYTGE